MAQQVCHEAGTSSCIAPCCSVEVHSNAGTSPGRLPHRCLLPSCLTMTHSTGMTRLAGGAACMRLPASFAAARQFAAQALCAVPGGMHVPPAACFVTCCLTCLPTAAGKKFQSGTCHVTATLMTGLWWSLPIRRSQPAKSSNSRWVYGQLRQLLSQLATASLARAASACA